MCDTCGCAAAADGLSKVEHVKERSRHLRGTIVDELRRDTPTFGEDDVQVLKFHGIYQQDDRDRRKEARKLGLDKHHQMMVRTRIPGGIVSPQGYLAHDRIADRWGNGTLRVTTRQDFQLHGVLKRDLRAAIRGINDSLLTTLGGCGDQERNIMCCPAPVRDAFRSDVLAVLSELVPALTPSTRAYHEIWLDGELAVTSEPEVEPLYGDRYLPRKFKTAIAPEGDNCVDVYANDLALVAMRSKDGRLCGFEVLVGGGLGRTRNKPDTFPFAAVPLARVAPDQIVETCRAVVAVQRDHGNRADRRHARLKYLLTDRGVPWFRDRVQERVSFTLGDPGPLRWPRVDDHLGWHRQGDGRHYLGVYVENGRIADTEQMRLKSALREIVTDVRPHVRLTPQQNVLLCDVTDGDRRRVDEVLRRHGVPAAGSIPATIRNSMACPAWPTCGLAVAEAERALPSLIRQIARLAEELGLAREDISYRMTGCPNGCARPYLGDVGLVGTTLGKYDVFLGGDPQGTRLNRLYASNVPLEGICDLLGGPLAAFRDERDGGEAFGDWCHRVGIEALRARFLEAAAPPQARRAETPEPVAV